MLKKSLVVATVFLLCFATVVAWWLLWGSCVTVAQRNARLQAEMRLIAKFNHRIYEGDWSQYIKEIEKFGETDQTILEGVYLRECKKIPDQLPINLEN